jgi:hypothetical protein
MRQVMGRRMGSVRGGGVPAVRRIRRITVAEVRCSGEQFRGGQVTNSRGSKGRRGRRCWGIYRCGAGKKRPGINRD